MGLPAQPQSLKVFDLSSSTQLGPLADGAGHKHRQRRRRRLTGSSSVELLAGLSFPAACTRLLSSNDGRFLLAAGGHPPSIKLFDLTQLGLKCERRLDADVIDAALLADDWSKAAMLCSNRWLALHARHGAHCAVRTPCQGRGIAIDATRAQVVVAGSSAELHRVSLDEGRFLTPLQLQANAGANAVAISSAHGLLAVAGENGALECFDPRCSTRPVGSLHAATELGVPGVALTALSFDDTAASGLQVAIGTSVGRVGMWDLRARAPLLVKDHGNGARVVRVALPAQRGCTMLLSADARGVKLWEASGGSAGGGAAGDGAPLVAVEPVVAGGGADVNDALLWPQSGLLLLACDTAAPHKAVSSFFVPALGPAPAWCAPLEALADEHKNEDDSGSQAGYDDVRFVARGDVERLGLAHLRGTALLRPHLHGFLVPARLCARPSSANEAAAPRAAAADQRRIARVRRRRVDRLERTDERKLLDERFAALFDDAEFAQDEKQAF